MEAGKRIKYRYFFLSFSVAFLALSAAFLWLMYTVHPAEAPIRELEPANGEGAAYIPTREEALTVLFVGVSAGSTEGETFLLARFDPARGAVPIVAFPRQTAVRNNGKTETLAQVYRYGGADYTRRALADTLGVTIDRYVRMDVTTFLVAAATVGSVEYELPQELNLARGDVTMTLSPGIQLLDGQKVAELIQYQGYQGGELARCSVVSSLTAAIVNQRIDIALSTVVDKVFEKIINLIETDISYADYDDRKQAAQFLARLGDSPAVAISVSGRFNENHSTYTLADTFVALMTQTFS